MLFKDKNRHQTTKTCYLTDLVQPGLFYKHLHHSFIHKVSQSVSWRSFLFRIFKTLSIQSPKSQGAQNLRECSSPIKCLISGVTCHVSHVRCPVSESMYYYYYYYIFFFTNWRSKSMKGLLSMGPTPSSFSRNAV